MTARTPGHRVWLRILFFWASVLLAQTALAWLPKLLTDEELAQSPVIVVGYWPKAKIETHYPTKGGVGDAFTKLTITRVIRGDVKPGIVKIMIGCISWNSTGGEVMSGSTTEMPGEVANVSKPCIWFLRWACTMNKKDPTSYLEVRQFQCVQPTHFLKYYKTLMRSDRDQAIRSCLLSGDPLIVQRSLRFVCGWAEPWPTRPSDPAWREDYDFFHSRLEKSPHRLLGQIPAVSRVIDRGPQTCRAYATLVYASLKGKASLPKLRVLVKDPNPNVAIVAAAYLVKFQDRSMASAIASACRPTIPAEFGCEMARAAGQSKDPLFIPALIRLLDCSNSAGTAGADSRIPAIYAQQELRRLTGMTFPFDAHLGVSAWQVVKGLPGSTRAQELKRRLGDWDKPLVATWSIDKVQSNAQPGPDQARIIVILSNTTRSPIRLSGSPASVDMESRQGQWGVSGELEETPAITVGPGKSIRIPVELEAGNLKDPREVKVRLSYERLVRHPGTTPWIGTIEAKLTESMNPLEEKGHSKSVLHP